MCTGDACVAKSGENTRKLSRSVFGAQLNSENQRQHPPWLPHRPPPPRPHELPKPPHSTMILLGRLHISNKRSSKQKMQTN